MTGDSEREPDNEVGEPIDPHPPEPAEDVARPEAAASPEEVSLRKPFRAWGSAQQDEGVLGKIGKRISGMFSRKKAEKVAPVEASERPEGPEFELIQPPAEEVTSEADEAQWLETDAPMDLESAAPEAEPLIDATAAAAQDESFTPELPAEPEAVVTPEAEAPVSIPDAADEPVVMWTPDYTPSAAEPVLEEPNVEAPFVEDPVLEGSVLEGPVVDAEKKPGFFARLFGRKSKPAPVAEPLPEVSVDEMPAEAASVDEPMLEEPVLEEPVREEPMVEEPMVEEPMVEEPVLEEPVLEEPVIEQPVMEVEPEQLPDTDEDEELIRTDEHAMPAPEEIGAASEQQETFASVEEALPADETVIEASQSFEVPVEAPKAGFFARLFARKPKPSAPRPSLEIEVHEDRIEAAAHALDEVSGESFATPTEPPVAEETFESVEEALPAAPEEVEARQDLGATLEDLRFAPPPPPARSEPEPEPVVADSSSTLEIEPFDPYSGDRDTVETTSDARSTLEMQQHEAQPSAYEPRSTEEIELERELGLGKADFSDTLEIDEKTDEFEIPSVDTERTTDEVDQPDDATTTELAPQTWWARLLRIKPKTVRKKAVGGATVVEGNPNFLFSKFRTFYNEIIKSKHTKTEFTAGFATAIVTEYTADLSPDAAAERQSVALAQMLELQLAEANWMGGEARDRYPDAQYAMAVLADEIYMNMEWDGQSGWKNHLLEVRLYKTRAADVELFKRIDKLLKERPNSHVARDLARVYLLVIAAGFQGKYRPFGLTRALADYRQRLFEYIHQNDSLMLYAPERRIFPDATSRTLEGHAVSRFSGAQRWAAILILMAIGYAALAHYAWNRVSADLKDVTERIRAASSTSALPSSSQTSSSNTTGAR